VYGLKIRGKQCKVNNSIVTVTSPGTTDKHTKTAEVCIELYCYHYGCTAEDMTNMKVNYVVR